MRSLFAICLSLLISVSFARADSTNDLISLGMKPEVADYIEKKMIYRDSSGNVELKMATGKSLELPAKSGVSRAVAVPTMASTPVAGTNEFYPGLNVVPTAAADTAALLGPSTPVPGQEFLISNNSGAAVRIKAAGGATLNGATAGGYITLASLATVECYTQSATNQVCLQPVIPTPAGP